MNVIETPRLILRPWCEDDAADLYKYARDPLVGPAAGWAAHKDETDSLNVLRAVLIPEGALAVTIKGSDEPVGSVGIFPTDLDIGSREPEIGYWIGVPFWGQGYIPEAVNALLDRCFEQGTQRVWCSHAEINDKSRRVIEKCGFTYRCAREQYVPVFGITRKTLFYSIEREGRNK